MGRGKRKITINRPRRESTADYYIELSVDGVQRFFLGKTTYDEENNPQIMLYALIDNKKTLVPHRMFLKLLDRPEDIFPLKHMMWAPNPDTGEVVTITTHRTPSEFFYERVDIK